MRILLCITLLISLVVLPMYAQKKALKKWLEHEKKFLYYIDIMEDYERAEALWDKMWQLTNSKFEKSDSLYALIVSSKAQLLTQQEDYVAARIWLEEQIPWLEAQIKNKGDLHRRHYIWYLYYGNTLVHLADRYTHRKELIGDTEKLPENNADRLQQALNYYNEAIEAYQLLAKYRPDHPDINHNLSVAYRDRGRLLGQYMGDLEACITSLEESVAYKESAETYRLLGVANGVAQRHHIAIQFLEKGLELDNTHIAIIYNLEVAYRQLADTTADEAAQEKYNKKADSYQIQWKVINPNYKPGN